MNMYDSLSSPHPIYIPLIVQFTGLLSKRVGLPLLLDVPCRPIAALRLNKCNWFTDMCRIPHDSFTIKFSVNFECNFVLEHRKTQRSPASEPV